MSKYVSCMCRLVHVSVGGHRDQERVIDLMMLEIITAPPPYIHTHTQFVPLNTDSDADGVLSP